MSSFNYQYGAQPQFVQFTAEDFERMRLAEEERQKAWKEYYEKQEMLTKQFQADEVDRKKLFKYYDIYIALYKGDKQELLRLFGYGAPKGKDDVKEFYNIHENFSSSMRSIAEKEYFKVMNKPKLVEILNQIFAACKELTALESDHKDTTQASSYVLYLLSNYFVEKEELKTVEKNPRAWWFEQDYVKKHEVKVFEHNCRVQLEVAHWQKIANKAARDQQNAVYGRMLQNWKNSQPKVENKEAA